ncbi:MULTISPECIES: EcsC family protein [Pseudomonas]|uniref:EcsC family protein n=1 Tax=Pseudomonas TaxID=286 RepID=UPI001552EDE1|nr:EcsC family protein [Pseudomonas tumuqii]
MQIPENHIAELKESKILLEKTSFIIKATDLIGTPIEKGIECLPDGWQEKIAKATNSSLSKSLEWATNTMDSESADSYPKLHMATVAATGAIGGAFGLSAIAIELPISTTVMLRSIADIARANGEKITDAEVRLQCLSVFSLGGNSKSDDAAESGYYAVRASLASLVTEAASHLAGKQAGEAIAEKIPALLSFIAKIAARFNIQVSEKAMAQLVPIIGAAGGAIINTLFIDHFQGISRGHFTVRRLERIYGEETVRKAYLAIEI